jgi:tRNA A-37 threonylcarbamoyl transferase component Bud32
MTDFPFELKITNRLSAGRVESVKCIALLRFVPRTRAVYEAIWQNKPVIVKVFSSRVHARRHLEREWWGLDSLQKLKINSPQPLFFGKTDDGQWAIVTEKIIGSLTAVEMLRNTENHQSKTNLFNLICKELAAQNERGVLQKDLHLGNFLVSNNRVFALDPARMRFFSRPLTRKESISQLALLACCLPNDDRQIQMLAHLYFSERRWEMEKQNELLLKKKIASHRKKVIRKSLIKALRTSTGYQKIRTGRHLAVFDRDFIGTGDPHLFLEQIDSLMDAGRILKRGNTSYVSVVVWNGRKIVVKRYNYKGFIYSLRITLKGSRAKHCWLFGHLLLMLGIATPKPVAFIEHRKGLLLWKAYIITEFVDGQKLRDFLIENNSDQSKMSEIKQRLTALLVKMSANFLTHGDLKFTNILVDENGLVLTDLDSMRNHKWQWIFNIRNARDKNNPHIRKVLVRD